MSTEFPTSCVDEFRASQRQELVKPQRGGYRKNAGRPRGTRTGADRNRDYRQRLREKQKKANEELVSQPKTKKIPEENKLIQMACANLNKRKETTESGIISKSWGSLYNQMKASQQIIVRKIISDVFFHGCVGSLQIGHVVQIQNLFKGQSVPTPNSVPQHQMTVPKLNVLKCPLNTPTPTSSRSSTSCNEEYSHSAQPQSPFVVYEESGDTLISSPTMSEQYVDTGEDFDLSKIKHELSYEEQ